MEIILQDDYLRSPLYFSINENCHTLSYHQNKIEYKISKISDEIILFLFKETFEKIYITKEYHKTESKLFSAMRRYRLNTRHGSGVFENDVQEKESILDLEYLLTNLARMFFSLKITLEDTRPRDSFRNLKDSYLFNTMYSTNSPLTEFMDNNTLLFSKRIKRSNTEFPLVNVPLRIYNSDIINYYKKAMSSVDPYIQYISFYHILEYYFDEIYHSFLCKRFKR